MNSPIVCDTPESINAFQMLALKGALKLESLGMRHSSGRSVAKVVKGILKENGKKAPTNKVELLSAFESHLRDVGILMKGAELTAKDKERETEMRQINGE